MNPDTARDPLSQRILDLTLEMIFLLTGEDHMVVKIPGGRNEVDSSCQMSEGHCKSPDMEPPPLSLTDERKNAQKILELANKITRLLTGEVPIRCEDVTVYLSMEEWEYVERHKELYEDVMMEDHQPVITLDKPVSGEFHTPVSLSECGTENATQNITDEVEKSLYKAAESAANTEQGCLTAEETHVPEKDIYPTSEHTEYSPTDMKEEPASCEEGNVTYTDMYEPPEHTSTYTGAESESHGEGDTSHPDIHPSPEHTQTEYPSTDIKEESPTYGEGNFTDSDMYEPPEHKQMENIPGNGGEYLKSNTNPVEINHSESLIESIKPDHSLYYTDLLTHNSVYKGHSALFSDIDKVSYSEPDLLIHETIGREEEAFSSVSGENLIPESALTHQFVYTIGQDFSCLECGEHFADGIALAKHQSVHAGKKFFKCTECGKCFTQASSLSGHKRIHRGTKTFKCAECGKCFAHASNLATHKIIHTGQRTHKCPECGIGFTCVSSLARHKRIHKGQKPFKCFEWGKRFTLSTFLIEHVWNQAGENRNALDVEDASSDLASQELSYTVDS